MTENSSYRRKGSSSGSLRTRRGRSLRSRGCSAQKRRSCSGRQRTSRRSWITSIKRWPSLRQIIDHSDSERSPIRGSRSWKRKLNCLSIRCRIAIRLSSRKMLTLRIFRRSYQKRTRLSYRESYSNLNSWSKATKKKMKRQLLRSNRLRKIINKVRKSL